MNAPTFHLRECRAWVRTSTHTVIREDEPDYARFVASGEGYVQRVVRVWLVDPVGAHRLRAYLGSVTLSRACPALRDLRRIHRQAETSAGGAGCSRAEVRAALQRALRRFASTPAGERAAVR